MNNNLDISVIIDQTIVAAIALNYCPSETFPSGLTEEDWTEIAQKANDNLRMIGIDGVQVDKRYILETIWGWSEDDD